MILTGSLVQRTLRRLKTLTASSHSEPPFESSSSLLTFTALRATTQHHAHVTDSITITALNERQSVRVSSGFLRTFQLTVATVRLILWIVCHLSACDIGVLWHNA